MDSSGSKTPQQSVPAGSNEATATAPTVRIEHIDESGPKWSSAAEGESRVAYRVGLAAVGPACLLIPVAVLNSGGAITVVNELDSPAVWIRSSLCLILLLVATQLVCTVLAAEHRAMNTPDRPTLGQLWVLRTAVVAAVVGAVFVAARGEWGWDVVAVVAVLLEGVVLLLLLSGRPRSAPPEPDEPAAPAPSSRKGALPIPEKGPRLLAIGASGGGIRAAAFVLGGYQSVRDRAGALRVDDAKHEPHVFAVSGGSYVAAALALRRTFRIDGSRRDTASDWRTAYSTGSPELERLRRHTRYLFRTNPAHARRTGLTADGCPRALAAARARAPVRRPARLAGRCVRRTAGRRPLDRHRR
ncbi:hypothetical protein [Nocardioides sp. B-3]|uniref:hypothetical protein n=1 Tax=Nocardioides sp. B-3 TaxID=2895565 RepID=UPI002152F4C5|nr:hypothetical protein [Nocardioides sp. B-3]UUZ59428.1 hypothetical protein LP418_27160 [Nocardioides sp. B-3]